MVNMQGFITFRQPNISTHPPLAQESRSSMTPPGPTMSHDRAQAARWLAAVTRSCSAVVNTLTILGRGLMLVAASSPGVATLHVLLTIFVSCMPVGQVWLAKQTVDALTLGGSLSLVLELGILYALTFLIPVAVQPLQRFISTW